MSYREEIFNNKIVIRHIREKNDFSWDDQVREFTYYAAFEIEDDGWENEIERADTLRELIDKL